MIYGYQEGGLSVIFPGSFLDIIKIVFMQIIFIGEVFLMILVVRNSVLKLRIVYFTEMILFLHFYGAILVTQGFLSDLLIRWFIPVVIILILDKIIILIFKKRSLKRIRYEKNN